METPEKIVEGKPGQGLPWGGIVEVVVGSGLLVQVGQSSTGAGQESRVNNALGAVMGKLGGGRNKAARGRVLGIHQRKG